jgi:DNA polymerase-3 subunit gamma/tau
MATDTVERAPLPSPPVEPAGMVAPDQSPVDGNVDTDWRLFLNALKPNVKAILREARPRIEATTLYLSFRYGFHHQWARDNKSEYRAQAQSAFGTAVVEVELATADPLRPTVAPLSPEEHPLVQETLRQLEGRVSRVREVRS